MGRQIDKAARADQVADAALSLFLENRRDAVTFEAIAERAGLNYWQVYRFHGNARTLFRAAVSRLVQRIETRLRAAPAEAPSVSEGVRRYTAFAAELMQDEAYAQFAYLLIRDRCVEPMLEEAYEGRIARACAAASRRSSATPASSTTSSSCSARPRPAISSRAWRPSSSCPSCCRASSRPTPKR